MNSKQTDNSLILIDQQGRTFEITKQSGWALGRDPSNTLVLNDIRASRRHASIRWEGKNYVIRDIDSRNGTYVNSKRVYSASLQNGDIVRIGDIILCTASDEQQQIGRKSHPSANGLRSGHANRYREEFRIHLEGFSAV